MIVFNLYLKILNKMKFTIIVYVVLFAIITLISMVTYKPRTPSFNIIKVDIAFIDNDKTEYTNNFNQYLSKYANLENIEKEYLDDAFFYRDIHMIIEIPENFTASLFNMENPKIQIKSVPESAETATIERAMNKYLNLSRIYIENNLYTDNLHESLLEILDKEANVELYSEETNNDKAPKFYFNYLAYVLMAMLISIIGTIMVSFKSQDIKRRNQLGTITVKQMNTILLLCNLLFGLFTYFIFIIISIILYSDTIFTIRGLLLIINAFIFVFTVISLAYLLVVLTKSINIIGGVSTVIALGASFLTGVFIPQFLLDETILSIAKFIPSYWYVLANEELYSLYSYNFSNLKPIFTSYFIQIIFIFIFIILALFISKWKQREEEGFVE